MVISTRKDINTIFDLMNTISNLQITAKVFAMRAYSNGRCELDYE